jgi:hypothetical protein
MIKTIYPIIWIMKSAVVGGRVGLGGVGVKSLQENILHGKPKESMQDINTQSD